MAKEKLSTKDILALARKQDGGGAGGAAKPAAEAPPAAEPVAEAPAPVAAEAAPAAKPAAAGGAPKSTAEILAAARAQKAGSAGAAPAAEAKTKPAAAGGAPKSTADILAAARAQKAAGSGAAAAPAAAKGEKKPAAAKAKAAVATADGDRPPIEQMLKALHEGKPTAAVAAKPKLPGKPPLPARRVEPVVTRRAFPVEAGLALAALIATPFAAGMAVLGIIGGLWGLLGARFMMPNMIVELPSKFKVGPASDFPIGTVSEKFKASRGVWLVHSTAYNGENIIYALASVCTHLGCTPNWLEGEQKFKCPCHGSGFYISGINFEGPAPRPLERVGLRVSEDGMLEVDKSVKFQEELGQWTDGKSFVVLG